MKKLLLVLIPILLMTTTVVLANPNPNWGDSPPTPERCSIGHMNPALSNERIYPGADDCGFNNGEAQRGSQHTLPPTVPFTQVLPPTP